MHLHGQAPAMSSMQTSSLSACEITPVVKHYAWGVKGSSSIVAQVWARSTGEAIQEEETYAELWYGTDPNGVGLVKNEAKSLDDFLKNTPQFNCPTGELCYLLKLLSNATALSIQCHPDKKTAQRLHAEQPHLYKSPNHKPEISLALTENVEALCGFKEWHKIEAAATQLRPLRRFLHSSSAEDSEKIKEFFERIMRSTSTVIETTLAELNEIGDEAMNSLATDAAVSLRLSRRLQLEYPNDVGCLSPFYLNYVVTQPGECLFTKANVLHAYINGQIVECMASSDNVIRGGLTPKHKDVELLLDILDYNPYSAPTITPTAVEGIEGNGKALIYDPKVEDFRLLHITVPPGGKLEQLRVSGCISATLVPLQGSCQLAVQDGAHVTYFDSIEQGKALLVKPGTCLSFKHLNSGKVESTTPDFGKMLSGDTEGCFVAVIAFGGEVQR